MKKIMYYDIRSTQPKVAKIGFLEYLPDECPICHKGQEPLFINAYSKLSFLEVIFKCHKNHCSSMFIATYTPIRGTENFFLLKVEPQRFIEEECSSTIKRISPSFERILNQARAAESESLDLIAGMGYRKALEFLIKDYLINHKDANREEIESKFLGRCINEYIENPKIKELAKRTAYLGNDETHYVRTYQDKDINDLKRLLDLTLHWIIYDIETDQALAEEI
jgi:hypothetical protein